MIKLTFIGEGGDYGV